MRNGAVTIETAGLECTTFTTMDKHKFKDTTLVCPSCPTEIRVRETEINIKDYGGVYCSKCSEPLMAEKEN